MTALSHFFPRIGFGGIGGKKGQFYIFTALVLLTYAFAVARPVSPSEEQSDAFKELHTNFMREAPIVLNNALYEQRNVSERFADYAAAYSAYAKTKSPPFGFLYLLKDNEEIIIGNNLAVAANVSFANSSLVIGAGSTGRVASSPPQLITVQVGGVSYPFPFSFLSQQYQLRVLFRQASGGQVRVYVS